MFSGIVEEVGSVIDYDPETGKLVIEASRLLENDDALRVSESVSVSGACLTVTGTTSSTFSVDVSPETIRSTWFEQLAIDTRLNLECALRYASRVGGHLVQGHVDGVGHVDQVVDDGDNKLVTITCPERLARYIVEKGFIAVDGVSLTTFNCNQTSFTFTLIPFTASHTTLGTLIRGGAVNIETDLTGKYIERFMKLQSG